MSAYAPLYGALVKVYRGNLPITSIYTDYSGRATLYLESGSYRVCAEKSGYQTMCTDIELYRDKDIELILRRILSYKPFFNVTYRDWINITGQALSYCNASPFTESQLIGHFGDSDGKVSFCTPDDLNEFPMKANVVVEDNVLKFNVQNGAYGFINKPITLSRLLFVVYLPSQVAVNSYEAWFDVFQDYGGGEWIDMLVKPTSNDMMLVELNHFTGGQLDSTLLQSGKWYIFHMRSDESIVEIYDENLAFVDKLDVPPTYQYISLIQFISVNLTGYSSSPNDYMVIDAIWWWL